MFFINMSSLHLLRALRAPQRQSPVSPSSSRVRCRTRDLGEGGGGKGSSPAVGASALPTPLSLHRDFQDRAPTCFSAPPHPDPRHPPASGADPPDACPTPPQDTPGVSNRILETSGTLRVLSILWKRWDSHTSLHAWLPQPSSPPGHS